MLGEILEDYEKGKSIRASLSDEKSYSPEVFLATVKDFADDVHGRFGQLKTAVEKALEEHDITAAQAFPQSSLSSDLGIGHDPAMRANIRLTEQQKHFLISRGPSQPKLEKFPINTDISKGKQNNFSAQWYTDYPLLEYSVSVDHAFCFACSLFGDASGCAETSWSIKGIRRWDKMKSRGQKKKGKLADHFTSSTHKLAVVKLEAFQVKERHVDVGLASARRERVALEEQERQKNRKVIKLLLDCCRYLSRQALAFRGSEDDANGNFRQLVGLLSRWVPFMDHWMNKSLSRPYHFSYMSAKSQNEFISLIGSAVRMKIIDEIKLSGIFAVMADTTPDSSHVDQISLIVRYVDENFEIKERLIMISEITKKSGDAFAQKIIEMLQELRLPLSSIRFQCYDTTASMSGAYNGAQAKLSERLGRSIPYITCLGHKTNLCVEHACRASMMIDQFFATLQQLFNFFTRSTDRFGRFKDKIEELQEGLVMKNLSKTRWIGRAESIRAVWIGYEILIDTLRDIECSRECDREARMTAANLLKEIHSLEFYLSLLFMKNVIYKMKLISLEVQEIQQDVIASLSAICETRDAMIQMRNDETGTDGIISAAIQKCESTGLDPVYEYSKKHRLRRPPKRIDDCNETSGIQTLSDYYRREIAVVLDQLVVDLNEINNYFLTIIQPITVLLPSQLSKGTRSDFQKVCDTFPDDLKDLDALIADIEMIRERLAASNAKTLLEAAQWLKEKGKVYPSLLKAYQLALTIPVSVASNERSFSKLKLVKTYLRSTMKEARLDSLMLAACSNDILDSLNLDVIADSWSKLKTRKAKI